MARWSYSELLRRVQPFEKEQERLQRLYRQADPDSGRGRFLERLAAENHDRMVEAIEAYERSVSW